MRVIVAAAFVLACCAPSAPAVRPSPSGAIPLAPASVSVLTPYFGSYRTTDGDTLVIARLGWFFDMSDAAYRTIYATSAPTHFTIGEKFQVALPVFAELVFDAQTLKIIERGRTMNARHIDYIQTDASIPAAGATLAATITEPLTAGPHPGIVVVHGAEPGQRYFYDVWVGIYSSLGITVLTYDKRGVGASTGTYPGEYPSEAALVSYAEDAAAVREFLVHWRSIDAKRVGFHGGSQGGWTVPLAMQRHPGPAFAILASAPAVTVDQSDLWAGFSGGGRTMPSEPTDQMLNEVRDVHSGYDPAPALRAISVPVLWLLGTNDRTVPTAVSIEVLTQMGKSNFTVDRLPTGHGLLVNPTGLTADDAQSPGLAPQLVPDLKAWTEQILTFG